MEDYKSFIKAGEKVIHIPTEMFSDNWYYDAEVVTIGKYRPYYTDGTPDPKPDEYDESCYVEIEGYTSWGESQISLGSLHEIFKEEKNVLYAGENVKLYGYDADKLYAVIIVEENYKVVDADDVQEIRSIYDLNQEELIELRQEICGGSIYTSDYINSLGIEADVACDFYDEFWRYLCEEYGEENAEEHDTPQEFAYYAML